MLEVATTFVVVSFGVLLLSVAATIAIMVFKEWFDG